MGEVMSAASATPPEARVPATGKRLYPSVTQPLVDLLRRQFSDASRLLTAFLVGAILLAGMGALSLVAIERMSQRVAELEILQEKVDRGRQIEYQVTAQSHYRAMALLTNDDSNNVKIADAKKAITSHLERLQVLSGSEQTGFFDKFSEADRRFDSSSERVLAFYRAGDIDAAMQLHLAEEHPISHELEADVRDFERVAVMDMDNAHTAFQSDRGFLTLSVIGFSLAALTSALVFGFVLSREIGGRITQLRAEVQILQVIIDETRREHEVSQIVDSEFFVDLSQRARTMRARRQRRQRPVPESPEATA
jgi:CHASE3 domain sensor protein